MPSPTGLQFTGTQRYSTVAEAAEYLGSSTKFVRTLIARGELTGYRIGSRSIRVDLRELDAAMTPIPTANDGAGTR